MVWDPKARGLHVFVPGDGWKKVQLAASPRPTSTEIWGEFADRVHAAYQQWLDSSSFDNPVVQLDEDEFVRLVSAVRSSESEVDDAVRTGRILLRGFDVRVSWGLGTAAAFETVTRLHRLRELRRIAASLAERMASAA